MVVLTTAERSVRRDGPRTAKQLILKMEEENKMTMETLMLVKYQKAACLLVVVVVVGREGEGGGTLWQFKPPKLGITVSDRTANKYRN